MKFFGRGGRQRDVSGSSNEGELHTLLTTHCLLRRRKAAVLTQLPAKRRQRVVLQLDARDARPLRAIEDQLGKLDAAASDWDRRQNLSAQVVELKESMRVMDAMTDEELDGAVAVEGLRLTRLSKASLDVADVADGVAALDRRAMLRARRGVAVRCGARCGAPGGLRAPPLNGVLPGLVYAQNLPSIVAALVGTIEAAGGAAFVRAPVGSILLEPGSGRAVGVRMRRGEEAVTGLCRAKKERPRRSDEFDGCAARSTSSTSRMSGEQKHTQKTTRRHARRECEVEWSCWRSGSAVSVNSKTRSSVAATAKYRRICGFAAMICGFMLEI